MTVPRVVEQLPRIRAFVLLRYTLIIATTYLLLVEHEFSSLPSGLILLIVVALTSNVLMTRLPARITDSTAFNATVIISDTVWITATLLFSGLFSTDFFYVYFFVLLLAAIGENLFSIAVGAIVACTAYFYILSSTNTTLPAWSSSSLIRIPFLFTAAAFFGYLVDQMRRERQRVRAEADTVALLELEISERTRVESALRESEERYRVLYEDNPSMYFTVNSEGTVLSVNQFGQEQLEYTVSELVGQSVLNVFHQDDKEEVLHQLTACVQNPGQTFHSEFRRVRRDGSLMWVKEVARAVQATDGKPIVLIVCEDITERKRAEVVVRESEARFRQIAEFVAHIIWMTTPDKQEVLYVNPAYERIFGRPRESLYRTPRSWREAIHPEDRERVMAASQEKEGEGDYQEEFRIVRPDGSIRWVRDTAVPITNEQGEVYMHAGIGEDITERKRDEQTFREAKEYAENLICSSLDMIVSADVNRNIVEFNQAAEHAFGYSKAEVLGRPIELLYADLSWDAWVNTRMLKDGRFAGEVTNKRKNGEIFSSYLSASLMRDANGTVVGVMGISRDITERKRVEEELRVTQLQLIESEKLESVGRLAAGVAHEVKNPLAIIQQGLAYVSNAVSTTDGDTVGLALEKMDKAIRRADRVIMGLLDFSAPRAMDPTPAELKAVLEESLVLVKHELVRAHITVVKELGEDLPPVKLDRQKIEQVFVNLFLNAIHAMPEGGTLTVKTDTKQLTEPGPNVGRRKSDRFRIGETVVVVEVEDTGTGVPHDKLDRVFDPFFSTKSIGQGTGLGLTVTRKIMELHRATIDIRNRPDGGVRVTLVFKLEGDQVDAEQTDPTH